MARYKPAYKPTNLAYSLKRVSASTLELTVTWQTPSYCKPGADYEFQWFSARVMYGWYDISVDVDSGDDKRGTYHQSNVNQPAHSWSSYDSSNRLTQTVTFNLPSSNWYPYHNKALSYIEIAVRGENFLGAGPWANTYAYFSYASRPTITSMFDSSSGEVRFTLQSPSQSVVNEWKRVRYNITRRNSPSFDERYETEKVVLRGTGDYDASSTTAVYDAQDYALLNNWQYIYVTCNAYMEGLYGPTGCTSKSVLIERPVRISIDDITVESGIGGKVVVHFSGNSSSIETVKLQRLYNTTIATKEAAASASGWEDVDGAVDNNKCEGFTDNASDATPEVRKHTWYRIMSYNMGMETEGVPMEAKVLYRARDAASEDAIKWDSITPSDDGESIDMRIGWAADNYTATQIAWASTDDAWDSNDQPEMFVMDWEDENPSGHDHTARFVLSGLESGEPVYIRARRVKVEDGKITLKGEWCSPPAESYPITPGTDARSLVLHAPDWVKMGEGLTVTWDYIGEPLQSWNLYKVEGQVLKVIGHGTISTGKCTVPSGMLPSQTGGFTVRLGVTTGSGTTYSEDAEIMMYVAPTLELTCPETLTAKPLTIGVESNLQTAVLGIRVISRAGLDPSRPDGSGRQLEGDIVWHGETTPTWVASGDSFGGTVDIDADFLDKGTYAVEAYAVDGSNGLSGDTVMETFEVDWAHKAPEPDATVTVDQNALRATVTPSAAESATETDVCDVYRLSGGTARLVAQGCEFGVPIIDKYAPFSADGSGLAYRVASRTVDGDVSWADVAYTLAEDSLVVDFDGERLSLPWGVAKTDSWRKPFTTSKRWDGSNPGYWDGGAEHTASLSTYIIEPTDGDAANAMRRLARHIGPCFVRLADGTAFAADVQVESYGGSMRSPVAPMSLSATEVDAEGEFMAGTGD